MTEKEIEHEINDLIKRMYLVGYINGVENTAKEFRYEYEKRKSKYKDESQYVYDGCDKCKYRNKAEHEEPCKNCCHNYVDKFRFDETAD